MHIYKSNSSQINENPNLNQLSSASSTKPESQALQIQRLNFGNIQRMSLPLNHESLNGYD